MSFLIAIIYYTLLKIYCWVEPTFSVEVLATIGWLNHVPRLGSILQPELQILQRNLKLGKIIVPAIVASQVGSVQHNNFNSMIFTFSE